MALTGIDRPPLTARFGAMRFGAFRFGFTPTETTGTTPGSTGPFYIWRRVTMPTTTWTRVRG